MAEYVASVDYVWKDEPTFTETNAVVVVLNDKDLYQEMSDNESFDERVFFYFQDDAEFRRAFDPTDCEFEFTLIKESNNE